MERASYDQGIIGRRSKLDRNEREKSPDRVRAPEKGEGDGQRKEKDDEIMINKWGSPPGR